MIQRIRHLFEKHGKHISTGALVFGFIFDFFTLTRIDRLYDNLVLLFYITVSCVGIFLFNYIDSRNIQKELAQNLRAFLPAVVQFAFGGLFSGISIFYLRSSTISINLLFILALFGLLIGNEFFRERYKQMTFQLGVLYFVLYSYLIFSLPILLKSIGPMVFILSGIASLGVMSAILLLFRKILKFRFERSKKSLFITISSIFVSINILYFLNIIPPIPLSLKEVNAYPLVYRSGDKYVALEENRLFNILDKVRIAEGEPVYVFSSVFSPANLDTKIVHNWQYFDGSKGRWISAGKIDFDIVGGRGDGFRGFTKKENIFAGSWRVDVETARGQLIGRETFRIEFVEEKPKLFEKEL